MKFMEELSVMSAVTPPLDLRTMYLKVILSLSLSLSLCVNYDLIFLGPIFVLGFVFGS